MICTYKFTTSSCLSWVFDYFQLVACFTCCLVACFFNSIKSDFRIQAVSLKFLGTTSTFFFSIFVYDQRFSDRLTSRSHFHAVECLIFVFLSIQNIGGNWTNPNPPTCGCNPPIPVANRILDSLNFLLRYIVVRLLLLIVIRNPKSGHRTMSHSDLNRTSANGACSSYHALWNIEPINI